MTVPLTRRKLISITAVGAALLPARTIGAENRRGISLMLRGDNLLADESASGYRQSLSVHGDFETVSRSSMAAFGTIVVPAFSSLSRLDALALHERAMAGHRVVLESGLGFADELEAQEQRTLLGECFGLRMMALPNPAAERFAYVQYSWPLDVMVRHFGPLASVDGLNYRPIAHVKDTPVAVTKQIGRGSIVFLGSPLGPLLMAGDREAAILARSLSLTNARVSDAAYRALPAVSSRLRII